MPARTDNVTDPALAAGLLLARRGQAYFSRQVRRLSDADFDGPSLVPGWSRRHVVAHVGLNARALTHLTEWAVTGVETPMYSSPGQRVEEIEFAATLPVRALRNLSDHAAVHLTVEWRDIPENAWGNEVRTAQGRLVPVSETVWMRTRETWIHAVDLGTGGSFREFPAELHDRLLVDVTGAWDRRREAEGLPTVSLVVDEPTAADGRRYGTEGADLSLAGPLWALSQWVTGRGAPAAVRSVDGREVPAAPRWL